MILKLKDRTEIIISEREATAIQQLLEEGTADFVHIGKTSISRSLIAGIFEGGLTEADVPSFEHKALEAGKRCRGQYSIQAEINNIAKAESKTVSDLNPQGLHWTKLISDKVWREQVRQRLRTFQPEGWCDYNAGECACEGGYLSTKPRHGSLV